jgi:hypothetical protein
MKTAEGTVTVEGEMKQHSGQAYTLFSNSINNMCITMGMLHLTNVYLAYFKGDDSLIIASEIEVDVQARDLITACGMNMKAHIDLVPEFTGFIVTKHGYFPDLLRKCTRVITKKISNEAYFNELKLNVAQDLAVVQQPEQLTEGLTQLSRHYAQNGIDLNYHELEYLYFYLQDFGRREYSELNYSRFENFSG